MDRLLDWLIPPAGADAEAQRDWQWRISMAILGIYVVGALAAAASLGQVFGVSGFASATAVAQTQEMLKAVRVDQVKNRIDQTRVRQCQAIMEGNRVAMQATYEQMQDYVNQHFSLAGFTYRVPDCGELIPYASNQLQPPTPQPTLSNAK